VTEDLVDEFYRPLVQAVGNLVILCAQCEASLLDFVAALQGSDEWQAQSVLKGKGAKERVLILVRASTFEGFVLSELLEGVENFWSDRAVRNRYYHDEWFAFPDEDGDPIIPAIRGLPLKKGADVAWDAPTADEIWVVPVGNQTRTYR
jgi:hypothetical protein